MYSIVSVRRLAVCAFASSRYVTIQIHFLLLYNSYTAAGPRPPHGPAHGLHMACINYLYACCATHVVLAAGCKCAFALSPSAPSSLHEASPHSQFRGYSSCKHQVSQQPLSLLLAVQLMVVLGVGVNVSAELLLLLA